MSETQSYIECRLDAVVPRLSWRPGPKDERERWQLELRSALENALGIAGWIVPSLDARIETAAVEDGIRRTAITFQTRPGYRAFGYLLEPEEAATTPGPAIMCVPGHGAGADAIVGLSDEPYQADFALQCARRGYRVLALEPMGFGHRASARTGPGGWSCDADARAALLLGETLAGWRIWDAMRGVDLFRSLPGIDPGRIGVMGTSGGGLVALWAAALDQRIEFAAVSGYFCTFRESILAIDHCIDNFVSGVLQLCELPDLAGLVAPRALFVESGTEDSIFPIVGFRQAVAHAKTIFEAFGCSENFAYEEFEGEHRFHGQGAFAFLESWLSRR